MNTIATYPQAFQMFVAEPRVFIGALSNVPGSDLSIVIHKTACGAPCTAQNVANYFATSPSMASTHFVIGLDGTVIQCVSLQDGAGGNCCIETGYDTYWTPYLNKYHNLNLCTISIEHCDPTSDNSTPVTDAQKLASFRLVKWLLETFNIPANHIKTHASIDPVTRARCPGNYPMEELLQMANTNALSKQAYDTWNSTAHLFGGIPPRLTSGIAQAWLSRYMQGFPMPPPLTMEYQSIDESTGAPVPMQMFAGLGVKWVNGSPIWFKLSGGLY